MILKKTFAEIAVKNVTKQLKKEKKDIFSKYSNPVYFNEPQIETDRLKNLDPANWDSDICEEFFGVYSGSRVDDSCFSKKSIPEIINAISESIKTNYVAYYREKSKESINNLFVAEDSIGYVLHESSPFNKAPELTDDDIFSRDSKGIKERSLLAQGLDDYLKTPEKKFCDLIFDYQQKMNIEGPQVYKQVLMSKQVYSHVISNVSKHPDFETCVQFAFAFKLTLPEAEELFRMAGRAFSDDIYHQIVKYFIENKCYDIYELNNALYMREIPPIGVGAKKTNKRKMSISN